MPLKIQNYSDWDGDKKKGHHPPNCTCYGCNEGQWAIPQDRGKGGVLGKIVGAVVLAGIIAGVVVIAIFAWRRLPSKNDTEQKSGLVSLALRKLQPPTRPGTPQSG